VLKTFWSEMSEIVKANCKELIYVRESAQSPSLGDPGNIHSHNTTPPTKAPHNPVPLHFIPYYFYFP
jgi:hypothetical protein